MSEYIDYLFALQYNLSSGLRFATSDLCRTRYERPFVAESSQFVFDASRSSSSDVTDNISSNFDNSSNLIKSAQDLALSCSTLPALREALNNFEGCELKSTAKHLVFGEGNCDSRIVFIGEAPGRDEDLQGKPFVGRSGRLLDLILNCIGLNREKCYITNIIPWRPPGNRVPSQEERSVCFPFLSRHIFLLNPLLIVLLGGVASKEVLGVTDGIMRIRGREYTLCQHRFGGLSVPVIPTFHPAYLLRQPAYKKLCWQDFLSIKRRWSDLSGS